MSDMDSMAWRQALRKYSTHYLKEVFIVLPPLAKLLLIFGVVNALLIVGTISVRIVSFGNIATIKGVNVGVYWDANCTLPVTESPGISPGGEAPLGSEPPGIDWGLIEPGERKSVDVYVRNEGNSECVLEIMAVDWTPENAVNYIGLTSDYQGQLLGVTSEDSTLKVSLILVVSPYVQDVTVFSFQIVIEAIG